MSDELEEDGTEYECQPLILMDGDCAIHDAEEFAALTNSLAWQWLGGKLLVLQRDTYKWVDVTTLGNKKGTVTPIKK